MLCMDEDTGICLLMVARCHGRFIYRGGTITSKADVLIASKSGSLRDWTSETTSSLKELRHCRTHVCGFLYLWLHEYLAWGCSPSNDPTLNRFSLHSECDSWWRTGEKLLLRSPLKVLHLPSGSMLTIAAPSRTTASTEGRSNAVLTSMHVIRSDFCPVRIFSLHEMAGGLEQFSCLKNSSRFPSLAGQAMYSLEKSRQSLLRSATWLLVLLDCRFSGVPNKGKLHLCKVSVMVWIAC